MSSWRELWSSAQSASVHAYFDLSSSDDSDWESKNNEIEDMLLLVAVQNLHDGENWKRKR
jgi:hypothetical protein